MNTVYIYCYTQRISTHPAHSNTSIIFSCWLVCLFKIPLLLLFEQFIPFSCFLSLCSAINLSNALVFPSWLLAVSPLQLYALSLVFCFFRCIGNTVDIFTHTFVNIHNVRKQRALLLLTSLLFYFNVSVVKLVYNDFWMFIACGNSDICNETTSKKKNT